MLCVKEVNGGRWKTHRAVRTHRHICDPTFSNPNIYYTVILYTVASSIRIRDTERELERERERKRGTKKDGKRIKAWLERDRKGTIDQHDQDARSREREREKAIAVPAGRTDRRWQQQLISAQPQRSNTRNQPKGATDLQTTTTSLAHRSLHCDYPIQQITPAAHRGPQNAEKENH